MSGTWTSPSPHLAAQGRADGEAVTGLGVAGGVKTESGTSDDSSARSSRDCAVLMLTGIPSGVAHSLLGALEPPAIS